MKTLLITAMLLSASCGLTTGKDNPTQKTGEFNHRLTSHWREGDMTIDDAGKMCQDKGQRLLSINSWRELNRLLNELTEMYWVPGLLKSPKTKIVKLWTFNRVNYLWDKGDNCYTDLDDEGEYCAVLVSNEQGDFHIEGHYCVTSKQSVACIRDDLYQNIIVGEDQLNSVTQTEAVKGCKDQEMELFKISSAIDQTNLEAELNRLGYPRIDNPGPHVFYLANKVRGNPGDTVNFTDLNSGDNCLIMKSRPDPDSRGGKYDIVVDDCTGTGRAVCTKHPDQGKFYRRLKINLHQNELTYLDAYRRHCPIPEGMYEMPVIETRQDMLDLSAELVRLGIYRSIVQLFPKKFFWLRNTSKANKTYVNFDDLDIEPRDIENNRGYKSCVGFSIEMNPTLSDRIFNPILKECGDENGVQLCVLKQKGAKVLTSVSG